MRGDDARKLCPDITLVQVPTAHGKADLTLYREWSVKVRAPAPGARTGWPPSAPEPPDSSCSVAEQCPALRQLMEILVRLRARV